MTATTATDSSGVEYYFECTAGGGNDSAWQDSSTYVDTGLTPSTEYTYRVQARDKSANQNSTAWSGDASATTDAEVGEVKIQASSITTTASSVNYQLEGYYTANENGLTGDLHTHFIGSNPAVPPPPGDGTMWLSNGVAGEWIQYEFDQTYTLTTMWVWNYNQDVDGTGNLRIERGINNCTIEYSTNGTNWTELGSGHVFAQADGSDTYAHNTEIDFASVSAKYVKITVVDNYGSSVTGLSEVRFYTPGGPADTNPPTPDPATFASPPAAVSDTEITMTATTGTDASGPVEYYFDETSGNAGGSDSGWTTNPVYVDSALDPATQYTYTVQMRDSLANAGTPSAPASATTTDTTPPSPDPATFASPPAAISDTEITMTAATGADVSGPVEYYFDETSGNPGGSDSSWTTDPVYTDSGLDPVTQYTYTVQMRDSLDNTGTASSPASATTTDTVAPSPDPATFVSPPAAVSDSEITMTATTGADVSAPVEYYFTETSGNPGASDSGWTTSPLYADSGLDPATQYTYTVQMRDSLGNAGASSSPASATTQADGTPPSPDPATFASPPAAISDSQITMTAATGSDFSGPVQYYFTETSGGPGGSDSGWTTNPVYSDSGLSPSTQYTYTVQMKDALDNTGAASAPASATTEAPPDTTAPDPDPMTWATPPYSTGTSSVSMTATTATDASGVEYYFDCTGGGGSDSGWQDGTTYEDTGLSPGTQYTYTVQARDKSPNQNATAFSGGASATTDSLPSLQLLVDVGCGTVQSGWIGMSACGTYTDVGGSGINVTLETGNPAMCECRTPGGTGTLADVEADLLFANDQQSAPNADFILTLTNLAPGAAYQLFSYHNRSDEGDTTIPNITVTGATNVTKPGSILQSHAIMDNPAEILFTAGAGDVVIRYEAPSGGCGGCQTFFNGFELYTLAPANPTIEFEYDSSDDLESVTPALIDVIVDYADAGETYTVDYAVTGGTATGGGVDYTLANGTLTFLPGDTIETISIDVVDDGTPEDDETIIITLSNPAGLDAQLGAITEHTYTILDPSPSVEFDQAGSSGMEDVTPVYVTVSLSAPATQTITVDYDVTGGTATGGGVDYTLDPGTLTFNIDDVTKDIVIDIISDANDQEPAETIIIELSNPTSAKLGSQTQYAYTILSQMIHLKVDFALVQWDDPNLLWEGSQKPGWWHWAAPGWADMYMHDMRWEDGSISPKPTGPGIDGTGIHACVTTGSEGQLGLHVKDLCRDNLAGDAPPYGTVVGDPIANSWLYAVDWAGPSAGDILLLLTDLPPGEYWLYSYHNHWEPCSQGTRNCMQCECGMPAMPTITANPLPSSPPPEYNGYSLPLGSGTGVTQIENAYDVWPTHLLSDDDLVPSLIKFETDGSEVLVIYEADNTLWPDCARPGREGTRGILNAFELVYMAPAGPDTTAPSPDPMTWQTAPYATSSSSISMTATTATDISGVEYYFGCVADANHDSGWQDSATYQDTGLDPNTQYTYRVQVRDKSVNQNATGWSTQESATTQQEGAYAPFPDSDTVGLWLFDEADYPHTTLTDASEYEKADLCLMDAGWIVAGQYGYALSVSGSDYAVSYAGFAGKVPEEHLREPDGTPSGLWGPTEGSGPLLNGLAGSTWTIEMWLNLASVGSGISVIDLGWAYDNGVSLVLNSTSFELTNHYAGVQLTCPTSLSTGVWQHLAFTYDGATGRHFVDGVQQSAPTVSSVTVQSLPDLQVPTDREHESRGFESMSYEQRRQNRFNFSVGTDRSASAPMSNGLVDEMRISRVVRYIGNFTPQSFSRNYGTGALPPSVADGLSLLFPESPPSPLQFGTRKHVFIDDAIVDTMSNVSITMNQPYGKQEITKDFTIDNSAWRPSVYDVSGVVHLAIPEGYGSPTGHTYLATSADGLTFNWQGTVISDTPFYGAFFRDLNPNIAPAEQYKVNAFVANRGMYMFISPDGVNWRRNETIQLPLRSGGEGECYWDDQRGEYASFLKRDSSFDDPECADAAGRVAPGFWSNEILKAWPFYHMVTPYFEGYPFPAVTCEGPVIFDVTAATQVYRTRAIKYPWAPDVYLAFVWRYPDGDLPRHVDLGVSRDGETWSFFGTSSSGPWYIPLGSAEEELSIYGLIRDGDEIWQYVDEGGAHGGAAPRTYYRYRQRLDGFVSLDTGGTTGTATTLPLVFTGDSLELNINASGGSAKVAICDQAGTELAGYGLADCDAVAVDSIAHEVTWGGSPSISSLSGTTVRLKFEMTNAKLYTFEILEEAVPDTTPPTPDPMTWDTPPYATGDSSISMTASTASDESGVEYYFACTAGGGHDSGWTTNPVYNDTGLSPATQYTYRVQARDKSPNQNETGFSGEASATTDSPPPDTTPPSPDPMSWSVAPHSTGTTSISMTATTATDISGVEYYFECTSGGGNDSGWQDSATYEDTGLTPSTQYCYRVQARDKSVNQNATGFSGSLCATTDTPPDITPPSPDPMTWLTVPYATGTTSIAMVADTATDASGVEYYFECTAGGGNDSSWQDSSSYEDTGLNPSTQYTYRMQARDKSPAQNATGFSSEASATTDTPPPDTTPPSPDPMTWATVPYSTGTSSIAMVVTTAIDASGVEYYFECTAGGGNDSGWQDSTTYVDTGLTASTQYSYRVQARDKSTNQNATAYSTTESATTDDEQPPTGVYILADVGDCGILQSGWVSLGACGTHTNVGGTGIDVTLATGDAPSCACRNPGGTGALPDVERDLLFADGQNFSPGADFILTLSNLVTGGSYQLLSYHSRTDEGDTTIPSVTVTGATNVTKPDTILQSSAIMDNPAEILFTAGSGDVVIRYEAPTGGCTGCQAFFNGFELYATGPTLSFESDASGGVETITPALLSVVLTNPEAGETYTVDYEATGGTATGSGVDYTLNPDTLTFNPGETAKNISIDIVDDGPGESDETIIVTLSNPTGLDAVVGISEHTYTISDYQPDVAFDADSSSGVENVTPTDIAVSLTHTTDQTVTVDYAVTGGDATGGGVDYTLLGSGTLTFDPFVTTRNISLDIVNDTDLEADETVILTLSNPVNATLGSVADHTFTILDDEAGLVWDGTVWYYSHTPGRLFVNGDGDLEWFPEKGGQYVTRIPDRDLSQVGQKVELTWWYLSDGKDDCPPDSCYNCIYCDDVVTCIAGTSDFRFGMFQADGEYVTADGFDTSSSIFAGYKGYNWRFGPHLQPYPTRWVDCTSEVHKTGNFAKKPQSSSNLMTINEGLEDYIPGFDLPLAEWSLFTISLERLSSSSIKTLIMLNDTTYTWTDTSSSEQPTMIDVFGIHMRNGRPFTRLVLSSLSGPDTTPPSPDPMTWAATPYATGSTSISMTATTATDTSGVEYYFQCTAGGGNDSGWQDSASYADTPLTPETQYTYRVQARDKSANQNATGWSGEASATTSATGGEERILASSITTTCSSVNYLLEGYYTADDSGLTGDLHTNYIGGAPPAAGEGTMWLSNGISGEWVKYEFDQVYTLTTMWVWNYNQDVTGGGDLRTNRGINSCTIEYSTDGTNWTELGSGHTFAEADGSDTYAHNTEIAFAGADARYVRITAVSNHGGSHAGLSEVRFYHSGP
ncbi:MAG: Calx-beta domain-containing protein [Planctomycetota bacterium]